MPPKPQQPSLQSPSHPTAQIPVSCSSLPSPSQFAPATMHPASTTTSPTPTVSILPTTAIHNGSTPLPESTLHSPSCTTTRRRNRPPPIPHNALQPGQTRYWTPSEHKRYVQAIVIYGEKDFRSIASYVGTRTATQCRTHQQKCFKRLMRKAMRDERARLASSSSSPSVDENKTEKEIHSVPASCGLSLLSVVCEEIQDAHEHGER